MNSRFLSLVFLASLIMIKACGSGNTDSAQAPPPETNQSPYQSWSLPDCSSVNGEGAPTFSADNGQTLTPRNVQPAVNQFLMDIALLRAQDTMLAVHLGTSTEILISNDAGCNWSIASNIDKEVTHLEATLDAQAIAWRSGKRDLFRLENSASEVTPLVLPQTIERVVGLKSDHNTPQRIRIVTEQQIYQSIDGGIDWQAIGEPFSAEVTTSLNQAAFNPMDLDHIVISDSQKGARVSFDGGRTWQISAGFGDTKVVGHSLAISPVDNNYVWLMGINLDELDSGNPSQGRHIYLSMDGGRNFAPVVDHSSEITLTNALPLYPHPVQKDIVLFSHGNRFTPLSRLYNYNNSTESLNWNDYDYFSDGMITALAFSPVDPQLLYLGTSLQIETD